MKIEEAIDKWIEQCISERGVAGPTVYVYRKAIKKFRKHLTNSGVDTVDGITKQTILDYKQWLVDQGRARGTIIVYLSSAKNLITFLEESGIIAEHPWPKRFNVRTSKKKDIWIPEPSIIFKIRRMRSVYIAHAAMFELLLSTGMRNNELIQIRLRDISWDKVSGPHAKASITLDPRNMSMKTQHARVVWVGPLANRLLLQHLKIHKITDAKTPIFPYGGSAARWIFQKWSQQPFISNHITKQFAQNKVEADYGFLDMTEEDIQKVGNPKIRNLIRRRQQAEANLPKEIRRTREPLGKDEIDLVLSPHKLRHLNGCIMYYKDWHDRRNNIEGVRIMLGHQRDSEVTKRYLKQVNLITDDAMWHRLLYGQRGDWITVDKPTRGKKGGDSFKKPRNKKPKPTLEKPRRWTHRARRDGE